MKNQKNIKDFRLKIHDLQEELQRSEEVGEELFTLNEEDLNKIDDQIENIFHAIENINDILCKI